ncbi:MAG: PAS domain-containing protein [Candidatus Aminicenantes bacterium]|nr:PAS domain-containing protein [Candidatus Aminicenantes bacterium]
MNGSEFSNEEIKRIAKFFRMGYYKTTKDGQFLECDEHAGEIFGIPESERDLSKYSITDLCEIPAVRESQIKRILENKFRTYSDTLFVRINGQQKILFNTSWSDNIENIFGLVREMEESSLLRSVRAFENMPTGFFHIEYAENDENHERERLTQCNDRFAHLLGFKNREDAIGINLVKYIHVFPEIKEHYFKDLMAADKKGEPLQKYPFRTKRVDTGKIIYLSMDVHLIKDRNGKVIGREGTIRDVTEEKKLETGFEESRIRLEKTTTDINKLIHTFLHPVVKFAGNSELLHQVGELLHKTGNTGKMQLPEGRELGEKLMSNLSVIRDKLPDIDVEIEKKGSFYKKDEKNSLKISTFKEKLTKIIYVFDYSLKTEESDLLLDNTIRDTALWVLDELKKINFSEFNELGFLIQEGHIEFLHNILFSHLVHIAGILKSETDVMKNEVEALRGYIGLQKERKYSLVKTDLRRILEENVERFKPIFLEKGIGIDHKFSGTLVAEISANDIERVICNILHNAWNYSYPGVNRFVKIKAREIQPGDQIELSIENFGIPIKKEEIDSGYIFGFGNRGELAFRSDRDGTGVGLTDAKETVEAHGGKLKLTSEPVRDDGEPPGYKVPYITTVTINLPKKSRLNEE